MVSRDFLIAGGLMILGHISAWFATNSHAVSAWWVNKPLLAAFVFGVPTTISFWYATIHGLRFFNNELWAVRFLGFGTSYLVFPVITWLMLNESMLTYKTITCIFLSFVIVCIQIFWR